METSTLVAGGGGSGGLGGGAGGPGTEGTGGQGGGGAAMGGAVLNCAGALELTNCTLTANAASGGTGFADGRGLGGGAFSVNGTCTITNCTVAGNAADDGGGIYCLAHGVGSSASVVLDNCILADNAASTDFTGTEFGIVTLLVAGTGNLIKTYAGFDGTVVSTADPALDVLAENGGPTMTMALPAGSPAIDAADDANAPPGDQRGYGRSGVADIGAFEYDGDPVGPPAPAGIGVVDDGCAAGSGGAAGWFAGAMLLGIALMCRRKTLRQGSWCVRRGVGLRPAPCPGRGEGPRRSPCAP